MRDIIWTSKFKKDYKNAIKRNLNIKYHISMTKPLLLRRLFIMQ